MMKDPSFSYSEAFRTLFLAILVAYGIGVAQAQWVNPPNAPNACAPGNTGCDLPINTGPGVQVKAGDFVVGSGKVLAASSTLRIGDTTTWGIGVNNGALTVTAPTQEASYVEIVSSTVVQNSFTTFTGFLYDGSASPQARTPSTATTIGVGYDFGAPVVINRVSLLNYNTGGFAFNIVVEYSSDDTTYFSSGSTATLSTISGSNQDLDIPATVPYRYWRIRSTNTAPSGAYRHIGELNMHQSVVPTSSFVTPNASIGVGTSNIHASAAFEVQSTTQGLLPPRMSTRPSNPAEGLIIYNSSDAVDSLEMYTSSAGWKTISTGAAASPIPAGAVMYFDQAAPCPTGWTELTEARGMYIVGLPLNGTLKGTPNGTYTALTDRQNRVTGSHTHNFQLYIPWGGNASLAGDKIIGLSDNNQAPTVWSPANTTGGPNVTAPHTAPAGTNAPYLQLLVCKKT